MSESFADMGAPILGGKGGPKQSLNEAANLFHGADQQEFRKAQYIGSLFGIGIAQQLQFLSDLIAILLGWVTVTVEVFTRHRFGERYLTILRIVLGLFAMSIIVAPTSLSNIAGGSGVGLLGNGLFSLMQIVVLIVGLAHIISTWRRTRSGERWHSMSFGISRLEFLAGRKIGPSTIDTWAIYRLIEPLCVLIVGIVIGFIPPLRVFSTWLVLASLAMFVRNNGVYQQMRGRVLDLIDSQIMSEMIVPALQGRPQQQTEGFVAVPIPAAQRKIVADAIPDDIAPEITPESMAAATEKVMGSGKAVGE